MMCRIDAAVPLTLGADRPRLVWLTERKPTGNQREGWQRKAHSSRRNEGCEDLQRTARSEERGTRPH